MSDINRSERKHSIYSPSSFERWSRCPGSAQLTADIPRVDTEYSLRGTWMHEQVERILRGEEVDTTAKYATPDNLDKIQQVAAAAKEIIDEHWLFDPPEILMEERLDLSGYDEVGEGVFGTGDLVVFDRDNRTLVVVDYKFGHNLVSPIANGQLLLYAIGAAVALDKFTIEGVRLVILQPEAAELRNQFDTTWNAVVEWWHDTARPAIIAAKADNAALIPGQEQCRWCPLSGSCDAQAGRVMGILEVTPEAPPPPTHGMLLPDLLTLLPEVEQWIAGVRAHAIDRLQKGESIPGYKLVEGRTHRKWADEEKAERWLAARKLSKPDRTETKLISIATAEKIMGDLLKDNERMRKAFDKLTTKPPGKPTLAREDDKRPALTFRDPFENDMEDVI